jgi:hypothetical protein
MFLNFFAQNVGAVFSQKPDLKPYRYSPCTVGVVKVINSIVATNVIIVFIVLR